MTIVLILALALAIVVAIWAWTRVAQVKKEAADVRAANVKLQRQMQLEREAYRSEAERLAAISTGNPGVDFGASIRILRELGAKDKHKP